MKTDRQVRGAVRTQWIALGGALVVLAGVLVVWALSNAGARVQVVQLVQDVPAGQPITVDDLTVTGIAYDTNLQGLVPAESLDAVTDRIAAVDLQAGSLLLVGMWRDTAALGDGEQRVGVVLRPGRAPDDLGAGDPAVAASMDPADSTAVPVRVLASNVTVEGAQSYTLAVPGDGSIAVARLAAAEQLVLVGGAPSGAAVTRPTGTTDAGVDDPTTPGTEGIVEP